ncbi:TRAP transporter small permease [Vineibacter terrae]|uniref:TRAP transporter small permease subunit n=1 Tax=Vineibacter terrae TaxID=2586908 RepID=UPI002E35D2D2|nr:TRAP transporter small permease [Vineibacter terrae]HEX2892323.1 TRAP transporter small permease [Vineibacter terrae]
MPSSSPPSTSDNPPGRGPVDRIVGRIAHAGALLAAAAIVAILVMVCAETALRQFRVSMLVTDEIAGYLNAAAVFLGLAWTLREGGFIRVEILYDRARGIVGSALRWLIGLTSIAFAAIMVWVCARHVLYALQHDTRAVSIIETPEWIPQSVMVIGLAILLLQLLAWLVARFRNIP